MTLRYDLRLDTAPANQPVTLAEQKTHSRITTSADDTYIGNLIIAATNIAEAELQRRLVTQTWTLFLDQFPCDVEIEIPYPPLQSVTYVKYKDLSGSLTALTVSDDYVVDVVREPGRVRMSPSTTQWPTVQWNAIQEVEIKFVCGYGAAAAVPGDIKQAIMMIAGHLYEHREDVLVGASVTELPQASKYLLHPWKIYRIV